MFPVRNPGFETYIAAAKQQPEPWRTALTIVVFMALLTAIAAFSPGVATYFTAFSGARPPPQLAVLMLLAVFPVILLAFWASLYLVHHRGIKTLISPTGQILWWPFFKILAAVCIISVLLALPALWRGDIRQQTEIIYWLAWMAPAVLLVFIQSFTEELIFRGYLLQQFATHFKSRWVWWLAPAVIFGLLHYNPATYGENAWLVVITATLFGLILADVTIRSGNLSYAIALHFANNFVLLLVFGTSGQLSALSLFLRNIDLKDPANAQQAFLLTLAIMAIAYLIYLLIMRQRR